MYDLDLSRFESTDPDYVSSWSLTDAEIDCLEEAADRLYPNLVCG